MKKTIFKNKIQTFLPLFLLMTSGVIAMLSLTKPGLYTSHDSESHIVRFIAFHQALNDGQFPPVWGAKFFNGLGSPVLLLNYQLPYFIEDGFYRLGAPLFVSFKLTLALSFILSGVLAFYAFKSFFGPWEAFLGAMAYTWAPYRLVDIYVRAALGEALAFVFPPLILLAIKRRSLLLGTLGFAGLFLSHPVASFLFTGFFVISVLGTSFVHKNWQPLKEFSAMFLLGLGLSSFNLFPIFFLTRFTIYTRITTQTFAHFPTLRQLVRSPWGYGLSQPGAADGFSFDIGVPQLLVFFLALMLLIWPLFFRKRFSLKKLQENNRLLALVSLVSFLIATLMMLQITTPLWKLVKLNLIIDYPWRVLMLTTFCAAILTSWCLSKLWGLFKWISFVFILLLIFVSNRNHLRINAIWPWDEAHYFASQASGDAYGEYTSIYRETRYPPKLPERVQIVSGKGTLFLEENRSHRLSGKVIAEEKTEVRFNIMYFPGWQYQIDGQKQNIFSPSSACRLTGKTDSTSDLSGLVTCLVPSGTHQFFVQYQATPVQKAGNSITVGSLVLLFSFLPLLKKEKKG